MTPDEQDWLRGRIQSCLDHAMEREQRLSISEIARALNAENHLDEVRTLAIKLAVESESAKDAGYFAALRLAVETASDE